MSNSEYYNNEDKIYLIDIMSIIGVTNNSKDVFNVNRKLKLEMHGSLPGSQENFLLKYQSTKILGVGQ